MSKATLSALHVETFLHELLYAGRAVDSDLHRLALCFEYLYEQWKEHRPPVVAPWVGPTSNEYQALSQHHHILQLLHKLEEHLSKQDEVMSRVETDVTSLSQLAVALTAAFDLSAKAQAAANERLLKDLNDLRNEIGSGNVIRLTEIADSIETTLTQFKNVQMNLEQNAAAEDAVDVAVIPTITPNGGTVPAGGQLQFSADVAVTWSCNPTIGGSIDTNGLYTAPATPGVSDTITAMSTDGKQTTSSVSVSIS